MKRQYLLFIGCLFIAVSGRSQAVVGPQERIVFSEQTTVLPNPKFNSQWVAGVGDVNGDGIDDIIRLNDGRILEYQLQLPNHQFETIPIGTIAEKPQYSIGLADLDANGTNDLVVSGNGDGVKLFRNGATEAEVLTDSRFFAQGTNLVDINGDGFLDIFVNNDTSLNRVWLNDGLGNFNRDEQIMPFRQVQPDSMNGGNYAAVWTDIDNDRDLDCFIARCFRRPIPNDPRLINQLFLNDGQGGYQETAASRGLNSNAQSWTADFQDIDNDGDMDCFLLNHYAPSVLLINDGTGHFTDETQARGIRISKDHFQCLLRDFDNDGWLDLLVAGASSYEVYQNKGDGTFKWQRNIFANYFMGTFATGDLNRDGFLDVYSASPVANLGDKLWINEQNDKNHFLGVSLKGKSPRLNAIGARVYLYGPWGTQTREVRAGESYGINNSMDLHFGLGENWLVDSLRVDWPDGSTEVYRQIVADQYIQIIQDDCLYPDDHVKVDGFLEVCPGEKVTLRAPLGFTYHWSNGVTTRDLVVEEAGTYRVTVEGHAGCSQVSQSIDIRAEDLEKPLISALEGTRLCEGRALAITLENSDIPDFLWSDGSFGDELIVTEPGTYLLTAIGRCEQIDSEPIVITQVDAPAPPVVASDTLSAPGNALLEGLGENLRWYDRNGVFLAEGERIIVSVAGTQTDTFYVSSSVMEGDFRCESPLFPVYVVVDPSREVVDPEELFLEIFPNPSQGRFKVRVPRVWSSMGAMLYSVDGVIHWQGNLVTGPNEIVLDNLAAGVYFLRMQSGVALEVRKVLIGE